MDHIVFINCSEFMPNTRTRLLFLARIKDGTGDRISAPTEQNFGSISATLAQTIHILYVVKTIYYAVVPHRFLKC